MLYKPHDFKYIGYKYCILKINELKSILCNCNKVLTCVYSIRWNSRQAKVNGTCVYSIRRNSRQTKVNGTCVYSIRRNSRQAKVNGTCVYSIRNSRQAKVNGTCVYSIRNSRQTKANGTCIYMFWIVAFLLMSSQEEKCFEFLICNNLTGWFFSYLTSLGSTLFKYMFYSFIYFVQH